MRTYAAIAAALGILAAPAAAHADPIADVAKAARLVVESDRIAHTYWANRGHPFARGVRYRSRRMPSLVYGVADRRRRIVYISSAIFSALLSDDARLSRWGALMGCSVIVHETGHLAVGYGHRTGYPAIDDPFYRPPACRRLARGNAHAQIASKQRLQWAPPRLEQPTTIRLGQGYTYNRLDDAKDYILELPPYRKVGGVKFRGGRNVVIKGGHVAIPSDATEQPHRRGIYVEANKGTVHIEGVLIEGSPGGGPGAGSDGIGIASPDSVIQIQNVRIVNISGGVSGWHADLVQPWGGVRELRVDKFSGSSNYQGFFIRRDLGDIGRATLQRVNLWQTPGPYDGGGHMLWLTSKPTPCDGYPVTLRKFFIKPRDGRTLENSVWPSDSKSFACSNERSGAGVTWPGLPVSGRVQEGPPPTGDFVRADDVGVGYSSPGYR